MASKARLELELLLKNKLGEGFNKAKQFVSSKMSDLKNSVSSFQADSAKAFNSIKDEVPGAARAMSLLANPYALLTTAALSFGSASVQATNMALDWERSMAEVNVTAQMSDKGLGKLSNTLLMVGAKGSTDLEQVPEAFNRIISAGLDANQSLKALTPTLKAAKAGFTDVETVAGAGIGVMKSSGEDINTVYDILFATLNKGNAKFQDIAQYLPKIIPGAKAAGFALTETAGAWAYLTAQGQSAEQATTGLQNAFKALSNPDIIYGSKSKGGFKALGVDVFDAGGKMRGILAITQDLSKVMAGLTDEQRIKKFASIGLDMEAAGAFASMTQNVEELKSTIDFTTNSTGQLDLAVENARTSTDSWKESWNKIKVVMIEWGQGFLPILREVGDQFNSFMDEFVRSKGELAVEKLNKQTDAVNNLKSSINPLLDEYDKLKGKANLTEAEHSRLRDIIDKIADVLPTAATGFDSFGNAMDINAKRARGFITASSDALKILNKDAIEAKRSELADAEFEAGKRQLSLKTYMNSGVQDGSTSREHINSLRSSLEGYKEIVVMRKKELSDLTGEKVPLTPEEFQAQLKTEYSTWKEKLSKKEMPKTNLVTPAPATKDNEPKVNGATAQKVINISIDAVHKGDNILKQDGSVGEGMTLDEFEKKMNEILLRLLRNSNAAF